MRGVVTTGDCQLKDGSWVISGVASGLTLRHMLTYWDEVVHAHGNGFGPNVTDGSDYAVAMDEGLLRTASIDAEIAPEAESVVDEPAINGIRLSQWPALTLAQRHLVAVALNERGRGIWSIGASGWDALATVDYPRDRLAIELDLHSALPTPAADTPLDQILAFRSERRSELLRFRAAMDAFVDDIGSAEHTQTALIRAREEIESALIDLHLLLDESRIQRISSSCRRVLGFEEPALTKAILPAIGGITAGALTLNPVLGSLVGVGVNAALGLTARPQPEVFSLPGGVREFLYLHSVEGLAAGR